ncbi:MAG: LysR family transcriptional regulator [Proteobacteria bacterium]|nr:LysR family transcriptional regulator [Pseudomonadota bacterium]MBI3497150.1 LysR family transcriptional regulator [Pseudomonadota bacterium]
MARILPSMSCLRAFEAAGRHLSFTRAAAELNLTQAAVSYRIKELEQLVGVQLFHRLNRTVMLTEHGRSFMPIVREALRHLSEAAEQLVARGKKETNILRILVTQAFSSIWLVPRLQKFRAENPDITVQVITWVAGVLQVTQDDFERHGLHAAIVRGNAADDFGGASAELIVVDYAMPVVHPTLPVRVHPLREVSDLERHTLLHAASWPTIWRDWLTAAGQPDLEPATNVELPNAGMTAHAAMSGLGVAIAHGPLVADDIAAGKLIAPFDLMLPLDRSYLFVTPKGDREHLASQSFKTWMLREMNLGTKAFSQVMTSNRSRKPRRQLRSSA